MTDQLFDDETLDQELENILNHPAPQYGDKSYWNSRYEKSSEPFEWYQSWSRIKMVLVGKVNFQGVALNLGCGNSTLSADLLHENFSLIKNIDFSDVVINQMKSKYASDKRLEWDVGDVQKMKYKKEEFDFIFDKATLDTLICGDNSNKSVNSVLLEISRLLKPNGTFIFISYGTPNTRKRFFENNNIGLTIVETVTIEKPGAPGTHHYIYIIKKTP